MAAAAHTEEIGKVIDEAMLAIETENRSLKNVLPKNYASPDLDKRVLGNVVDIFTNMDMGDAEAGKDLLGRTYEYCIAQFAAYEGVKGGEFYTPASIVKTIVAILKPFDNCRVYDPCCGSGGMFVQSVKFLQAHSGRKDGIAVYGQESNADTWKMAKSTWPSGALKPTSAPTRRTPSSMTCIPPLRRTSSWPTLPLTSPTGASPSCGMMSAGNTASPRGQCQLRLDPAHDPPPCPGRENRAGAGQRLPVHPVFRRGGNPQNIIEADLVEGIVALPPNLFYSVTIPVTLWFISKNKRQKGKTLFIDARKMGTMVTRKHRDFSEEDIRKLADAFEAFQKGSLEEIRGFCAIADLETIKRQDYILTPGRYVGIEEQEDDGEPFEEKWPV